MGIYLLIGLLGRVINLEEKSESSWINSTTRGKKIGLNHATNLAQI